MLKFFSVLLGIGLILWMGCGEKQPTEGDETGSIQGRVVSAADSTQGLRDIQVDAWQEGQRIASATTDSLGNYVIEDLSPGIYNVMVSSPEISADTLKNIQNSSKLLGRNFLRPSESISKGIGRMCTRWRKNAKSHSRPV